MEINWTAALGRYGYLAVLLGAFLEGESMLVAGALAAHAGVLNIYGVLGAGLAGSFLGDQMFFAMGRRWGRPWLAERPRWQARAERVYALMVRHDAAFILGFRFLYGLRSVSPFVVGASNIHAPRFIFLNFCGALLWTCTIVALGYFLGNAWSALPPGTVTPRRAAVALSCACVLGLVVSLLRRYRRRRRNRGKPPA